MYADVTPVACVDYFSSVSQQTAGGSCYDDVRVNSIFLFIAMHDVIIHLIEIIPIIREHFVTFSQSVADEKAGVERVPDMTS